MRSINFFTKPPIEKITVILAVALCLMPMVAAFSPRFLAFAPGLIAVIGALAYRGVIGHWPVLSRPYMILVFGISALCALSSLWSFEPLDILKKSAGIFFILGTGAVLYSLCKALDKQTDSLRTTLQRYFPVVMIIAVLVPVTDLLTHGFFYYLSREQVHDFNPSSINRSSIALLFMAPITVWFLYDGASFAKYRGVLFGAFNIVLWILFYKTDSQTAQLAAILFLVLSFAFFYPSQKVWIGLGGIIVVALLSTPWVLQFLFDHLAHFMRDHVLLQRAFAAERLEIWDFVARRALEQPMYGFGLEAASYIEHFDSQKIYVPLDHVLHPHNFALQIWLEFGAIGAALASAAIIAVLRAIYKLGPVNAQRILPLFLGVMVAAATSYGLWQGWWLGLFTILPVLCLFTQKKSLL